MREIYNIKEGENLLSYYKRITDNRKEYGLSYEKWGELIVGENRYSDDNCRKALYIIKPLLDSLEEEVLVQMPKNKMEEIKEELGELFITKQEIKSKTSKLNRIKKDFAKSVEIANDIKEYLKEDLSDLELFEFDRIEISSNNKLIIQLADIHVGYVINNYKGNTYNYEIAQKRLSKLISEAEKYCNLYDITDVAIVNCGDVIENSYMRETQQAFECEFNMSQQVSKATKLLYEFVSTISTFANVDFISIGGNHSRMASKAQNIEGDNCNVPILETLELIFECNDRVRIVPIDYVDDSCEYEINGLKFLVVHGDNRVADCKKLFDSENVDVILRGHYHNFNVSSQDKGGMVITAGCLFGYNPYSKKRMACTTNASQTLIVVGDKEIELIKNVDLQIN